MKFTTALDDVTEIRVDDIIKYHRRLFNVLSEIIRKDLLFGIKRHEDPLIGEAIISYYVDFHGVRNKNGILYSRALEIMKISLGVLQSFLAEERTETTLQHLVINAVKLKQTEVLESFLDFQMLPILLKTKDETIKGDFLKPLVVLSQLSHGKMTVNLAKIRLVDFC